MKTRNILFTLALFGLMSCGGDSGGGGGGAHETAEFEMTPATPGTYYAVLRPINFYANGFIAYGAATFKLQADQLIVSTSMDDDQAVTHRQSLHIGTRCPTINDDRNGDGFVDYEEALTVVGKVLIPLDNDLNSQQAGAGIYPRGKAMTYNKTANFKSLSEDLWRADEDPTDDVMKLAQGTSIGLEKRVVLIHGTSHQSTFPASLASVNGEPAHLSLPVVCGVLSKIE